MKWMFPNFIERPWLALIPVLLFSGLFAVRRQRLRWLQFIPISLWLLYFLLEGGMYLSCGPISEGGCNIRIDLLLIYPVLLSATVLGVVVFVGGAMWKRETPITRPPISVKPPSSSSQGL
jgi:formate hydrogenlyase subunit 3/multisubunit Na+/H+ antiporter MnhD subunit